MIAALGSPPLDPKTDERDLADVVVLGAMLSDKFRRRRFCQRRSQGLDSGGRGEEIRRVRLGVAPQGELHLIGKRLEHPLQTRQIHAVGGDRQGH